MEDQREFKTKGGHQVVIRTYLTGADKQRLQRARGDAIDMTMNADEEVVAKVSATVEQDVDNALIDLFVISIDGETADIQDKVLGMRVDDYDEVVVELRKVYDKSGLDDKKKPKSRSR